MVRSVEWRDGKLSKRRPARKAFLVNGYVCKHVSSRWIWKQEAIRSIALRMKKVRFPVYRAAHTLVGRAFVFTFVICLTREHNPASRLSYPLPKLVQARLATPGVLPYKRMGSGVVLFKFGRLLHCQLIAMVACKIVWLPTLYYFTTYMHPWPWRGEGQKSSTHGSWMVVNRKR